MGKTTLFCSGCLKYSVTLKEACRVCEKLCCGNCFKKPYEDCDCNSVCADCIKSCICASCNTQTCFCGSSCCNECNIRHCDECLGFPGGLMFCEYCEKSYCEGCSDDSYNDHLGRTLCDTCSHIDINILSKHFDVENFLRLGKK